MINQRLMRHNPLWETYWEKRWVEPLRRAA